MSEVNSYSTHGAKPPSLGGEQRHRFELHSPYGPDGESWLERSYAATVLREVRAGYEEIRAQNPGLYIGMTAYGSAVKGRFHPGSDLDLILFVDPKSTESHDTDVFQAGVAARSYITDGLAAVGLYHEVEGPPRTFFAIAMNETIVQSLVERALSDLQMLFEMADSHERQRLQEQGFPATFLNGRERALFYMQIGGGKVRDLRRQLLDALWEAGDGGDLIWRGIATSLSRVEEGRRGASIYFPDTLEKAYPYFGFKEPEFTLFELGGDGVQKLSGGGAVRLLGSARKARQKVTADV